jgi:hypothetical protein
MSDQEIKFAEKQVVLWCDKPLKHRQASEGVPSIFTVMMITGRFVRGYW